MGRGRGCVCDDGMRILVCSEVNIYIKTPEGVGGRALDIEIGTESLRVGLKGNPPYLEVGVCMRVLMSICVYVSVMIIVVVGGGSEEVMVVLRK